MTIDLDDAFEWCIEANLPHPIISALMALANSDITVAEAWCEWEASDYWSTQYRWNRMYDLRAAFIEAVEAVTDDTYITCYECSEWAHTDDTTVVADGEHVCEPCLQSSYTGCRRCGTWAHDNNVTYIQDVGSYCDSCRDNHCSWCEHCEEYYRDGNHDFDHPEEREWCDCEAPHPEFEFPANGDGTITNDERLAVRLPAGTIDDTGLRLIRNLLWDNATEKLHYQAVTEAMDAVGDLWQAKKGNYTRRLSRELYAKHGGAKIPEGVLTEIGNLARQHSSDTSEWSVEFTRNLNLDASEFCHADSCWWGSYFESRCALKQWGGLGLRAFDTDDLDHPDDEDEPDGRAWVQPLRIRIDPNRNTLVPTHDTLNADAYLVYNCYGTLDGARAARIVAHLTSRTYRKVDVHSDPQFINGNSGWLVADETTCVNTDKVLFSQDAHHTYDARTI